MGNPFQVLDGDEGSKQILVEILHLKGEKQTGLKEFLADLEETESNYGKRGHFWVAVDKYEKPRGALTVRYLEEEQMSYLRSIWTRVLKTEDQFIASKALLDAWMRDTHYEVKKYQADLPLYSPLTESIQKAGFEKEKMLLAHYEVETDWEMSELPQGYTMRPVNKDELQWIYHHLIEPDLDPASPIYLTEDRFLTFVNRVPDQSMESWVLVENENGEKIGFAASFPSIMPGTESETPNQAVMFGPHTQEASVQLAIIQEMMTYWRAQGVDTLKIVRSSELYPSVIEALETELINSTVRFVLNK